MNSFKKTYLDFYYGIRVLLNSPAKWMTICFALWVFRVSCLPAGNGFFIQALQIGSLGVMAYYAYKWNRISFSIGLFRTGLPVMSISLYMLLGLISTIWSYKPGFTFFMSFEKIAFIAIFFSVLTIPKTFLATERFYVLLLFGMVSLNWVALRITGSMSLMHHNLQEGSCAAMCLCYCFAELMSKKVNGPKRLSMFRVICICCLFFMFTSTSGGANASAALGIAIAFLVSGRGVWGIIIGFMGGLLFFNEELFDNVIGVLMQGKTEGEVKTATGRTKIWEIVMSFANEKPILGWGYAAIERYIFDKQIMPLNDVHSNFYGAYGNTGLLGLGLLIFHHISSIVSVIPKLFKPGMAGVFCALICGTMNGYSYGFLVGKTALISVAYIGFVMLTFVYSNITVETPDYA